MERLIRGLSRADAYPHAVGEVTHIETHISHVLIAGAFAYKLKKPVDLGFVDYTTLARRKHFCEAELRLNRRLASDLYLETVAITGSPDAPRVGGAGEPIEYAVKMRAFRQSDQWDRVLARGKLTASHVEALADRLAAFHAKAEPVEPGRGLGGPEQVADVVRANFELTRPFIGRWIDPDRHARLAAWSDRALERLAPLIRQRLESGFVRECHGDAHLQNVAFVEGRVAVFDGIEFNDTFRFIDVMAEIAFTKMDLDSRGHPELGARFLNRYLEMSGDYQGVALLPLYLSYRALVRAKVACLSPDAAAQADRIAALVQLADGYAHMGPSALVQMHGVTGCGKSTVGMALLERLGAIRIRSDVERKRLAGVGRTERPDGVGAGLYRDDMSAATYARLRQCAEPVANAGFVVILDATYLQKDHRLAVKALAQRLGIAYIIVSCRASRGELERRIRARMAQGTGVSDGTLAVLAEQLQRLDPLDRAEAASSVVADTESWDGDVLSRRVACLVEQGFGVNGRSGESGC